jgi:hypothetical protein
MASMHDTRPLLLKQCSLAYAAPCVERSRDMYTRHTAGKGDKYTN